MIVYATKHMQTWASILLRSLWYIGRMSRSVLQRRKARSIMKRYPYSSITLSSVSDQKAEYHLWVGVLAVLGPARDADIFLAGLKVHGRGVIEHNGYITAQNLLGMV